MHYVKIDNSVHTCYTGDNIYHETYSGSVRNQYLSSKAAYAIIIADLEALLKELQEKM